MADEDREFRPFEPTGDAEIDDLLRRLDDESRTKALESEAILALQLKQLQKGQEERLVQSREQREQDRLEGRARAEELFPEGTLGRVDEDPSAEILGLIGQREELAGEIKEGATADLAKREAATEEAVARLRELEAGQRDPSSDQAKLARSAGVGEIQRALAGSLRAIRGQENIAGVRGSQGAITDALGAATAARGSLERDIALGGMEEANRLAIQGEVVRQQGLSAQEDLRLRQQEQSDILQRRLEDLQGAIREDTLRRQLLNIDQSSREVFGRLGTEENIVAQGIAERSGIQQQLLAEAGQAESTRAQREAERLRQEEINKPPPQQSGGGGKSLLCIHFWQSGDITDQELLGDFIHTIRSDFITEEVRMFYYYWTTAVLPNITKDSWTHKLFRPFVTRWARDMAAREIEDVGKRNLVGTLMRNIGAPLHHIGGKVLKWFGYTMDDMEERVKETGMFDAASHLWLKAHKTALHADGYQPINNGA